ncbi:unnamed protein product [Allacma fusca]|uniref:Uncharacterized protein n=1 Tax=Allacma fusca TaxID=39272 RepID=A0A8J2K8S6_9HEXA|nr:unnamed protein product [Allacma fusca]
MKGYAVDSEGSSCFQNIRDPRFGILMNKTNFESNWANETGEFCPKWPRFKQCLKDHVNSDRCNEETRQLVIDSEYINVFVVLSDLLCNPGRAPAFRNLIKATLEEDILACAFGEGTRELSEGCNTIQFDGNGYHARFQDLPLYFECMKPGVRKCANGDLVKEVRLIELWDELSRALQDTHRELWD